MIATALATTLVACSSAPTEGSAESSTLLGGTSGGVISGGLPNCTIYRSNMTGPASVWVLYGFTVQTSGTTCPTITTSQGTWVPVTTEESETRADLPFASCPGAYQNQFVSVKGPCCTYAFRWSVPQNGYVPHDAAGLCTATTRGIWEYVIGAEPNGGTGTCDKCGTTPFN